VKTAALLIFLCGAAGVLGQTGGDIGGAICGMQRIL
jgi:hypothetical protein